MKVQNRMRASFPARSVNEAFARTLISAFAATVDPTVDQLIDIKTAVSEAVTNAIVHGYREELGQVYIAASLYPDDRLVIRIRDTGCGIPDVRRAMEPLYTTCTSGERAGLGFAVMQELMDKVQVRSIQGKGTTVTLEKRLKIKG